MSEASRKPNYQQVFAVLRVDKGAPWPEGDGTYLKEGIEIPRAGPGGITVKEVVITAAVAQAEVLRLNSLNADKECVYSWQTTHLFLDGGSHGSAAK